MGWNWNKQIKLPSYERTTFLCKMDPNNNAECNSSNAREIQIQV